MDVDLEELGKLLYPNGVPDNEDFHNYVIQLASCGVDKLCRESSQLGEERRLILEETQDLVYKNYETFIHSADCSRAIFKEFLNVESHLEEVLEGLPLLKEKVGEFAAQSRGLAQGRRTASLTLARHTQLLEILELPQLMETCVRNGYYDDALNILAYVARMEKRHAHVPLVAVSHSACSIVNEVKSGTRLMVLQVLLQLRQSVSLPECLKAVGLLRRVGVLSLSSGSEVSSSSSSSSEAELKVKFLQARETWFESLLKTIPKEDPYHHISKVVEVFRVNLFDIVTQFRAIFAADDDVTRGLASSAHESAIWNEQTIFHGWIGHKIEQFLSILEEDLARGVGPNLESLLDQCMFFGQSFSRVGADFRNMIAPIFQKAVLRNFCRSLRVANSRFDESLSSFSLLDATDGDEEEEEEGKRSFSSSSSANVLLMKEAQCQSSPPLSLMAFPPLAHYTNGVVAAFNALRQCCPVAALKGVAHALEASLKKVVTALLDVHRLESSGFTEREGRSFGRMCASLSLSLLPFLNSSLRALFPLHVIAGVCGVARQELMRTRVGQLDEKSLMTPLEQFLPKKEVILESEGGATPLWGTEREESHSSKERSTSGDPLKEESIPGDPQKEGSTPGDPPKEGSTLEDPKGVTFYLNDDLDQEVTS